MVAIFSISPNTMVGWMLRGAPAGLQSFTLLD
jgi:hypothetical protein